MSEKCRCLGLVACDVALIAFLLYGRHCRARSAHGLGCLCDEAWERWNVVKWRVLSGGTRFFSVRQ